MEAREAIWRRQLKLMHIGLSAANLIGAVTVFAFLTLLVPAPEKFTHDATVQRLNLVLSVLYLTSAIAFANYASPRATRQVREWFLSGADPGPEQREAALRQPLVIMRISAVIWGLGAIVFTVLNAFWSGLVAAQNAITISFSGLVSCALTYLLAERFSRDVTAAALGGEAPSEPVAPGVAARVLVAWGVAAAYPLFGCALVAIGVLVIGHWTPTRIAVSLLIVCVVGMILGFDAMVIVGRSITDPVKVFREALARVRNGDLNVEIPVFDGSEIGLMQADFNEMTAGLRDRERIREAFGTYLDHDVAEHILREGTSLTGEEVEITAMFIDIRNFTGFAERVSAGEAVTAINSLFERIVPTIHAHGGHVDKFIGDGLLAVFGAPRRQLDHADQALDAALKIAELETVKLSFGIGLNSGAVIAGNVGGAGRLEFTVIGDAVNVAARVEAASRMTDDAVLVSDATYARLAPDRAALLEERSAAQLKGKSEPIGLYAPTGDARGRRQRSSAIVPRAG